MKRKYNHYLQKVLIRTMDMLLAGVLITACLPLWLSNIFVALVNSRQPVVMDRRIDAAGRSCDLYSFSSGWLRKTLSLQAVLSGRMSFVGLEMKSLKLDMSADEIWLKPGLFSLTQLHRQVGLASMNESELIRIHQSTLSLKQHLLLLIRGLLNSVIYADQDLQSPERFILSGVAINNHSMEEAVDWAVERHTEPTRIGFFVNVNSMNIARDDSRFRQQLTQADKVFADGSGVRLAAAHVGYRLRDNVNGTDLLPHLCESMVKNHKRLYLLGAEPGIAKRAAIRLSSQFPGLMVVGHHHGYFEPAEEQEVIDDINRSGASILLVALGSPIQENWLLKHRNQLRCQSALAVGGLFDFYSGSIKRSPLWLREMGMEWIYRLLQEPGKKWRRYLLGNPRFLYNTYFAQQEYVS